jgi:hypothetical protein
MKHNVEDELQCAKRRELEAQQLMESTMTQNLCKLMELEAQLTADDLQAISIRDKLSEDSLTGTNTTCIVSTCYVLLTTTNTDL